MRINENELWIMLEMKWSVKTDLSFLRIDIVREFVIFDFSLEKQAVLVSVKRASSIFQLRGCRLYEDGIWSTWHETYDGRSRCGNYLKSRSCESQVRQPAQLPRCSSAPNYEQEH